MLSVESYRKKSIRQKSYPFSYDHRFADYISGDYDIANISKDILHLTNSKMCSIMLVKPDSDGVLKQITVYNTDPKISLCQNHPLFSKSIENKTIIISNDTKNDPRVMGAEYDRENCPIKSLCAIPIIHDDVVYGQILLTNKKSSYGYHTIDKIKVQLNMIFGIVVSSEDESSLEKHNFENIKFLQVMSHGVRTFIHSIVSMTSLLKKSTNLTSLQHEYTNRILESCENLVGTVSDSLDFQKLKTGILEIENSMFNLEELLEKTISLLQDKAVKKGLYMNWEIDINTPKNIYGDYKRVKQILINLIVNAVNYTDTGGITVKANVNEHLLQISVKDTGCGISNTHIHDIFDDYYQIEPDFAKGLGLGLSICKRLARMMGGDMSVISMTNPPTGSIFSFTLPLTQDIFKLDENRDPESFKVMIVNPFEKQRILLREYMNQWKINCEILSSFKEARNFLSYKKDFEVFMVDVSRDFGDALMFLRIVQNGNPESKVIALNQEIDLSGFDCFVKPSMTKLDVYNSLIFVKNVKNKNIVEESCDLEKLQICIVEDDDNSAFALKQILIALNVLEENITCVDSGEKCVRTVTHSHFDIVFIDCRLNGKMNGITATKLIKQQVRFIKVYGISAELTDEEKSQWFESGLEGLLMKPFNLDVIEPIIVK